MCYVPKSQTSTVMGVCMQPQQQDNPAATLLELAACDDVPAFRRAVEDEGLPLDAPAVWYGRWWSEKKATVMGYEQRTPLMVAALYGSAGVVGYIISRGSVDVNRPCGSDSATALHCAAAGGAASALQVVRLLVAGGADVTAFDCAGKMPVDVVPRQLPSSRTRAALEAVLRGGPVAAADEEEAVVSPKTPKQVTSEKKEYPVDVTLPDIKSGIYLTDEFRMYTFKVKPCSRAYSHDWTECPFVHPGENARRRDPRKYHYSCVPCPEFRKGACRNGDACEYAHGVFESWLHPAQYRTRLCKDETGCNRRVCFFAHKPEELRPLYPSAGSPGSVVSSPRASMSLPPLDLGAAAAAMLMNQQQPMSPSSSTSAALAAAVWLNQTGGVLTPTSQLPSSRLKAGISARDMDLDLDLMGFDGYLQQQQQQHHHQHQQQLIDEIGNNRSSPPSSWSSRNADYGDVFGSLDSTSLLSPLKSLSMKQSPAANLGSQFSSPPQIPKHQHLSGFGTSNLIPPPSANSLATALMNSRASAFAKRSQSFIDRGAAARSSLAAAAATMSPAGPVLSDWGSPDGKLDWGIQGEELNKLRKSASFGFRSNGTHMGGGPMGSSPAAVAADEPDVSWVQSLVKDGPSLGGAGLVGSKKQYHLNSGAGEFHPGDKFSSWADQLYLEQEQLVA